MKLVCVVVIRSFNRAFFFPPTSIYFCSLVQLIGLTVVLARGGGFRCLSLLTFYHALGKTPTTYILSNASLFFLTARFFLNLT